MSYELGSVLRLNHCVSHRVWETVCVLCCYLSISEATLKPGRDSTRAGGTRRQEQLPTAQENKLNPLLVFFVLLHCIIYAGAGTDSQLDLVNQSKLCCG